MKWCEQRVCCVYVCLLLAGLLAMGAHVYLATGRGDWLALPRISGALSAGLLFGHALGFVGLMTFAVSHRWLALLLGCFSGMVAWGVHSTLTLYNTSPDALTLLAGGVGLGLACSVIRWARNGRWWQHIAAFVLAWALVYAPIYISYQRYLLTYRTSKPQTNGIALFCAG